MHQINTLSPRNLLDRCPETDPDFLVQPQPCAAFGSDFDDNAPLELAEAPQATPFTVLSAGELLERELPERVSVWGEGIIVLGQLSSILGQGGTGKSRFAMQLAIFQILGRQLAGFATHPTPLKHLLIGTENSIHRQQQELRKMISGFSPEERDRIAQHLFFHVVETLDDAFINIGSEEIVSKWRLTLERVLPDCIYIDPFGEVIVGDSNKDADVRHTLRELTKICRRHSHDTAIVVIHHARTGRGNIAQAVGYDKGNYGIGSKALYSGVRSQINLAPADAEDSSRIVLSCGKSNDAKPFKPMGLKMDEATMHYLPDSSFNVQEWLDDVEGKRNGKACSIADVIQAVGQGGKRYSTIVRKVVEDTVCSPATAKRRIKEAADGGYIHKRSDGSYLVNPANPTSTQIKLGDPF